ncbi:hypothetical protein Q8F57_027195 [Paraburkholderia terrae]|uniref:hypothetical protein n=1 Tax=Paraburkholderia terrae TaxID=311230 RepID=UPI00296A9CEC|nr:hypothetical protein [Paraburkholderia terrae]MDW3660304.1 hypothetical protein [Paraburkholderia terrae]
MEAHEQVVEAIEGLRSDLNQRHTENIDRLAVTDRLVHEAIGRIDQLHKAFPEGDCEGHRRYHEAVIRKMEDRAEFWKSLRNELASKGLWAVVLLLAAALWAYLKAKVSS